MSESADSTDEAGEPAPGDPVEGCGGSDDGACGGTDDEDIEPRDHLNATTQASETGSDGAEGGTDDARAS